MIEEGRDLVSDRLWPGLQRYFVDRIEPGGFLLALLSNDLMQAVGRGDERSLAELPDLCRFLYTCAPAEAHGSPEKVRAWLAGGEAS